MKYQEDYVGPIDHDDGECFCCNHSEYGLDTTVRLPDDVQVLYCINGSMFTVIEKEDDKG